MKQTHKNKKMTKHLIYLFLIFYSLSSLNLFAKSNHSNKIPTKVQKFAEKHQCTNLKQSPYFDRPFYGYKGYDVFTGPCTTNEEDCWCVILHKFGSTRFPKNAREYQEATLLQSPPLPPGLWWQYYWEIKRYHLD